VKEYEWFAMIAPFEYSSDSLNLTIVADTPAMHATISRKSRATVRKSSVGMSMLVKRNGIKTSSGGYGSGAITLALALVLALALTLDDG
jgi:hypothetical protein